MLRWRQPTLLNRKGPAEASLLPIQKQLAHRATADGKRVIADRKYEYDADHLRSMLRDRGTIPIIRSGAIPTAQPNRANAAIVTTTDQSHPCRLKDFPREIGRTPRRERGCQTV